MLAMLSCLLDLSRHQEIRERSCTGGRPPVPPPFAHSQPSPLAASSLSSMPPPKRPASSLFAFASRRFRGAEDSSGVTPVASGRLGLGPFSPPEVTYCLL